MSDLNAKALEAAIDAALMHPYVGDDMMAIAILTYLEASGIGAVVGAAREWENAYRRYQRADRGFSSGIECREVFIDAESDFEDASDALHAAVAALDKEPGHD